MSGWKFKSRWWGGDSCDFDYLLRSQAFKDLLLFHVSKNLTWDDGLALVSGRMVFHLYWIIHKQPDVEDESGLSKGRDHDGNALVWTVVKLGKFDNCLTYLKSGFKNIEVAEVRVGSAANWVLADKVISRWIRVHNEVCGCESATAAA